MVTIGADASNAFAEAPPPVAPLYIYADDQYREWWSRKFPHKEPIKRGMVMKVKKALQGHPESPRLWSVLINRLLIDKLHLKPTTHEPCLYSGKYKGNKIYFLRQVDDFAIACDSEDIAKGLINTINNHMTVQIKYLGLLTRFNGVDIDQTQKYIKISSTTYINKILCEHDWVDTNKSCHTFPIPITVEAS